MTSPTTRTPTSVPPLPLEQLLTLKPGDSPRLQLTASSDRSCATRVPSTGHDNVATTAAAALACLEAVADTDYASISRPDVDCATPRGTAGRFATLNLRSPSALPDRAAQTSHTPPLSATDPFATPTGTPRVSVHSPRSPAMMSPLRLVGTKSPCSVRLTASARLAGGAVLPLPKTTTMTPRPASAPSSSRDSHYKRSPKQRPSVQRSLPFSARTPAASKATVVAAGAGRTQPSSSSAQGRELSFSDLLRPSQACGAEDPATDLVIDRPSDVRLTPRKRSRKNAAPQRADCGVMTEESA